MSDDPIQGQGHEPLKVGNSAIFKSYLLRHLQWELATGHSFSIFADWVGFESTPSSALRCAVWVRSSWCVWHVLCCARRRCWSSTRRLRLSTRRPTVSSSRRYGLSLPTARCWPLPTGSTPSWTMTGHSCFLSWFVFSVLLAHIASVPQCGSLRCKCLSK